MRVQSIISSFAVVLGNYALHLALAILSKYSTAPSQEEMEDLQATLLDDEDTCVSVDDLTQARRRAYNVHMSAFVLLVYFRIHTPLWTRIVSYCGAKIPCCEYKKEERAKSLNEDDIKTLKSYNKKMKITMELQKDSTSNEKSHESNDKSQLI